MPPSKSISVLLRTTGKEISRPFLTYQGEADPTIHPPTVEAAINDTAQKFPDAHIESHLMPTVTRTPTMHAGLPVYLE